uniref:DUF4005 domain-containing protein n=1 Tax=Setaria italica TaxID=4555 RepID=K3YDQ2_SETIT
MLVARVHLAMALAALPALLPTPPRSKMLALLPTPHRRASYRADAVERWDARKNAIQPPSKPGRADAVERWDARKTRPASPASSVSSQRSTDSIRSSPGRASSSERWDADKKTSRPSSSSSSSSNRPSSRASSCASHWGGGSRASSSAKRWDAHKKPRPPASEELDDGASSTGSNYVELDTPRAQRALYAGPGFLSASPEPSMLPMPSSLMLRVAAGTNRVASCIT